jgi:hypothetical protein
MAKTSFPPVRSYIDCTLYTWSRRATRPRHGTMRLLTREGEVLILKYLRASNTVGFIPY